MLDGTVVRNPSIPFVFTIPGGHVAAGQKYVVKGKPHDGADRFCINFIQNESQLCIFHLDFRFDQDCTVRNSNFPGGNWREEDRGPLPLHKGHHFKIEFAIEAHNIKVEVNGDDYCEFFHLTPNIFADTLQIQGDVEIDRIKFK